MELKRIESLAKLMEEAGLTHLELREEGDELILARETMSAFAMPAAQPVAMASPASVVAPPAATEAAPIVSEPAGDVLTAPLVGTIYMAASPEDAPFVSVGSNVKKGQVLCIIEAMKVMNEFTAPRDGKIIKISAENGQLVEYGAPLFTLE